MFDLSAIDPNRMNELAMTANPFPILQQMTMSVNPQTQFGTQEVMQGGFGDMIYGSVGSPGKMGIVEGEWDWMKGAGASPGAAPLSAQQLSALQGMMPRGSSAPPGGGIPGRPGQVALGAIAPARGQSPQRKPTLSELIGGR